MTLHTIYETSAGGIVYSNKTGSREWLVIQHSKARHWGFPKGHVGDKIPNEKLEEAALREVDEEGGIRATIISNTPFSTTYFFKHSETLHKKTVHYFLMAYVSGNVADHDTEVSQAIFLPAEEVVKKLTYDSDRTAFAKALQIFKEREISKS
ncbi:NUDIX hydrolase [soil metagenome]